MNTALVLVAFILLAIAVVAAARRMGRREGAVRAEGTMAAAPASPSGALERNFVLEAPDRRSHLVGEIVPKASSLLASNEELGGSSSSRTPKAWNQAIQTLPNVSQAIQRGELVRIIGPDHLVNGIAKGELAHTITKSGVIGAVKGPDGKFVGHLRFESAGSPATVAGPLVVFQLASAVTMQYYLHQMTTRLVSIEEGIDDLKSTLSAQNSAKIRTGAQACARYEPFMESDVTLSSEDRDELANASQGASEAYETLKDELTRFQQKVDKVVDADGRVSDAGKLGAVFDYGTTTASKNGALFLEALDVRMRLLRLKAFAELDADPARAELIRRGIEEEIRHMRTDFEELRVPFDQLNIRRDELRRWGRISGAEELERFRNRSKGLRAIARTPVRRVLPEPPLLQPFVVELTQGPDGEIESRYALLEPASSEPRA